jgi:hypothetical protein
METQGLIECREADLFSTKEPIGPPTESTTPPPVKLQPGQRLCWAVTDHARNEDGTITPLRQWYVYARTGGKIIGFRDPESTWIRLVLLEGAPTARIGDRVQVFGREKPVTVAGFQHVDEWNQHDILDADRRAYDIRHITAVLP